MSHHFPGLHLLLHYLSEIIHLGYDGLEAQPLCDLTQALGHILAIPCLGSIEDECISIVRLAVDCLAHCWTLQDRWMDGEVLLVAIVMKVLVIGKREGRDRIAYLGGWRGRKCTNSDTFDGIIMQDKLFPKFSSL